MSQKLQKPIFFKVRDVSYPLSSTVVSVLERTILFHRAYTFVALTIEGSFPFGDGSVSCREQISFEFGIMDSRGGR